MSEITLYDKGVYIVEERYIHAFGGSSISLNRKKMSGSAAELLTILMNSGGEILSFGQTLDPSYLVLTWTVRVK